MCYCPVTRRRCLDPLVSGALLVRSTLPPQEITLANAVSSGNADGLFTRSTGAGASRVSPSSALPSGSSLPFPSTIRALRSSIERVISARALGGGRPTPGPSVRRPEAARGTAAALSLSSSPSPPPVIAPAIGRELRPYGFPSFFLRQTTAEAERVAIPRILAQLPTTLYADSSALARGSDELDNDNDNEDESSDGDASSVEVAPAMRRPTSSIVTLAIDTAPVTRNLLSPPDALQARWLNPPTLLECGHVIAHKTFLDLRGTARRTARTAAAPAMSVVCCPYCSKITATKDALTLSYLY